MRLQMDYSNDVVRVLQVTRLSVSADDSTSLTRQDIALDDLTAAKRWALAGKAVDDGVSASKVRPFDRPDLGPWLTDPELIRKYDVISFWRLDRAIRSMRDMAELAHWAKDHHKSLWFAVGPTGGPMEVDMSNPAAEFMLLGFAFAAQIESQATKERVQSSHDYLATQPRWASGAAPYGYRTVDRIVEGVVQGKTLEVDPQQAKILQEIVDDIIHGESLLSVCANLNRVHVPAPTGDYAYKGDRSPQWHPASLGDILRSERLLGQKVAKGHPVFTGTGEPLMLADPIIDVSTFLSLQQALVARASKSRTRATCPLLGVLVCGACGGAVKYQAEFTDKKGHKRQSFYRCRGNDALGVKRCSGVRQFEAELMDRIEEAFLANIGHLDRPERTFVPGTDSGADLELVSGALARLRAESDNGLIDDESEYLSRLAVLTARKKKLAALEAQPDRWEEMPSGKTWGQWWEESPEPMRRDLLLSAGFKVWLLPGGDSVAYWPGNSGLTPEEFLNTLQV